MVRWVNRVGLAFGGPAFQKFKGNVTNSARIGREAIEATCKVKGITLRQSFIQEACAVLKASGDQVHYPVRGGRSEGGCGCQS